MKNSKLSFNQNLRALYTKFRNEFIDSISEIYEKNKTVKFSDTSAYIEGFSTKKFNEYLITKNEYKNAIEYEQAKTIFFLSMIDINYETLGKTNMRIEPDFNYSAFKQAIILWNKISTKSFNERRQLAWQKYHNDWLRNVYFMTKRMLLPKLGLLSQSP
ncbi:hypothetical protein [Taylorella equigenitalis]|uniref:hypothetical protein n=1 Tax=Taylorella equigenitalis TaxID=29575 RepID=UPI0005D13CAC|nr:hypothetical protein [Taylorella equigenitalis]ASY31175.1 hypothetical protein B9Z30_07470 [Taylorella equigenitalis]ASY38475.1 hypothetical protein CA605_07390 [Taylorella equigenitalis]KOS59295.1 hypothetical protein AM589_01880 [Taylorella equigenitalis]RBA27010.1 hypothetical protein DQW13_00765 [Taylorella equigenitalis]WDU46365.1 hypothetical protein KNO33_07680 [Taylorella equigenitalis]